VQLQQQLDRLQTRLMTALRDLPGATALYLFGSRATRDHDHYADIDLHLVTADLPAARAVWPHFLERVGTIDLAWPITAADDNTVFSILFHGESYFHKVDISLGNIADSEHFVFKSAHVPLWSQPPSPGSDPHESTKAYLPSYGTPGHLLFDTLIESVRYIKARKRGHDLTCWRFLHGKPDRLLQLMYEQAHSWQVAITSLSTPQYKELDLHLDPADRARFVQHLDWSNPSRMDRQLCRLTQRIADLLQQKALAYGEAIPANLVEQHLAFICHELGIE